MLIQRVHMNPKDALPLAFLRMHTELEHFPLLFPLFPFVFFRTNSNETQRQVQAILTWVYSGLCRDAEDRQL